MIVEVINYNGQLMYLHPSLNTLVPAPEGMKAGQRMEFQSMTGDPKTYARVTDSFSENELPIDWEDRPKL